MTDAKTCSKCNSTMAQGNEYSARNQYMYVFAPDDDPGPDLSKMFSASPMSKSRKPLVVYCCEQCGFVEFYGLAAN